jgi:hypothetical protein
LDFGRIDLKILKRETEKRGNGETEKPRVCKKQEFTVRGSILKIMKRRDRTEEGEDENWEM